MASLLPKHIRDAVKAKVFEKADAFGYAARSRRENSVFMNELVEDPEVGIVIKEYIAGERVRTYIKDGILNSYTKSRTKNIIGDFRPAEILLDRYLVLAEPIQIKDTVTVCRSEDGGIYIISTGTVLKWETALRKALEVVACEPKLIVDEKYPKILLLLAIINDNITEGDSNQITDALNAVGVQACFCTYMGC